MDDVKQYLPTDKCDYDSIDRLKSLKPEELQRIIPELLEWIQDINWPVAPKIIEILIPLDKLLLPQLRVILRCNEYDWIENCLWYLVRRLNSDTLLELRNELVMLSKSTNPNFIEYEIPQICKEIMSTHSME
ncbi:DUF5071 domain-containing protein [Paenibacillus sp. cl6col]|uniref:DUF5071 domain-containing protein n=1 Tax=Paenibacillus sp. cl6col TaxID=1761878 RepID=UPI00158791E0|nr:DUF5071 domain-containing protein [Paenibacillus sp. cl6col]